MISKDRQYRTFEIRAEPLYWQNPKMNEGQEELAKEEEPDATP